MSCQEVYAPVIHLFALRHILRLQALPLAAIKVWSMKTPTGDERATEGRPGQPHLPFKQHSQHSPISSAFLVPTGEVLLLCSQLLLGGPSVWFLLHPSHPVMCWEMFNNWLWKGEQERGKEALI